MKRIHTHTLALALVLLSCFQAAIAQNQGYKECGTQQAWNRLVQQHPEALQQKQALDRETQAYLANPASRGVADTDSILVIPVVVHIIHNFGGENISDVQVDNFLRIVNEDFSKRARDTNQVSAPFKPLHGNSRIEFRLARLDPNGNCTIGITRTISALTMDGDDRVKDLIRWPPEDYLNVWVVNTIEFAGAYAYYPGAPREVDGIVCRFTQFGPLGPGSSNFAERTMTHEIGHYLNLAHTWGNSNQPGDSANCGMDDYVTDTPNTVGTSNQGCNLNRRTCGEIMPDNVENYMDYSNCGRMFTLGQKARMRAAAFSNVSSRSNLWSFANLIATGTASQTVSPICAPILTIPTYAYRVCPGQEVRFVVSVNNAKVIETNFLWEFPGSSTPTSTQPYPRVTYITPGVYPIKLKVYNNAGADSVEMDSSIVVRNPVARYAPGDSETFAGADFPIVSTTGSSQFWEFESSDGERGWSRSLAAGAADMASMKADLRSLPQGGVYSVLSPGYDLSAAIRPTYVIFKYAGAKRLGAARNDQFTVYVSNNCGINWNIKARRTAASSPNIYTLPSTVNAPWVPDQADFVEQRVNVDPYVGRSNVRFKFEVVVGTGGNSIYLDDIKVLSIPTGIKDRELLKNVEIMPNPASTLVEVSLPSWPESKPVSYDLLSPLGQKVVSGRSTGNQFMIDVSPLAKGIYILSLDGHKTQRIVVE